MKQIKAIVFDFDGLILDTETFDYKAWQAIYRDHGVDLPLSTWLPLVGDASQNFDIDLRIAELTGKPVDRAELRKRHRAIFLEMLEGVAPMPGVEDYLCAAKRLGIRVGIASGSRRSWVLDRLDQIGLVDHFETIVCRDDVGSAKPDPAAYLAAVSNLGVHGRRGIRTRRFPYRSNSREERRALLCRRPRADDQESVVSQRRHAAGVPC